MNQINLGNVSKIVKISCRCTLTSTPHSPASCLCMLWLVQERAMPWQSLKSTKRKFASSFRHSLRAKTDRFPAYNIHILPLLIFHQLLRYPSSCNSTSFLKFRGEIMHFFFIVHLVGSRIDKLN